MRHFVVTLISLIFLTNNAFASRDKAFLECTIGNDLKLASNGTIERHTITSKWGKFHVDRRSGRISGKDVTTDNYTVQVLDVGEDGESFELVAYTDGYEGNEGLHRRALFLVIQLFVASEDKPFLLYDMGFTHSGLCRYE